MGSLGNVLLLSASNRSRPMPHPRAHSATTRIYEHLHLVTQAMPQHRRSMSTTSTASTRMHRHPDFTTPNRPPTMTTKSIASLLPLPSPSSTPQKWTSPTNTQLSKPPRPHSPPNPVAVLLRNPPTPPAAVPIQPFRTVSLPNPHNPVPQPWATQPCSQASPTPPPLPTFTQTRLQHRTG